MIAAARWNANGLTAWSRQVDGTIAPSRQDANGITVGHRPDGGGMIAAARWNANGLTAWSRRVDGTIAPSRQDSDGPTAQCRHGGDTDPTRVPFPRVATAALPSHTEAMA